MRRRRRVQTAAASDRVVAAVARGRRPAAAAKWARRGRRSPADRGRARSCPLCRQRGGSVLRHDRQKGVTGGRDTRASGHARCEDGGEVDVVGRAAGVAVDEGNRHRLRADRAQRCGHNINICTRNSDGRNERLAPQTKRAHSPVAHLFGGQVEGAPLAHNHGGDGVDGLGALAVRRAGEARVRAAAAVAAACVIGVTRRRRPARRGWRRRGRQRSSCERQRGRHHPRRASPRRHRLGSSPKKALSVT